MAFILVFFLCTRINELSQTSLTKSKENKNENQSA